MDLVLLVFLLLVENFQCHMMSQVNENRHWNWDVSQGLKSENPKPFLQPSFKKFRPLIIGQTYRSILSICLVVPVPVLSFCSVFNQPVVYVTVVQSYPIWHGSKYGPLIDLESLRTENHGCRLLDLNLRPMHISSY